MFLLNGQPLAVDTPFTANDIQYPANWLRLSSEAEKIAIGITEVADPVRADDRFYWNGDINNPKALEDKEEVDKNGNPLYVKVLDKTDPKNPVMVNSTERLVTKGLKSQFIAQVKAQAGSLLAQTDWKVIRAAEGGKALDDATKAERIAIRTKSDDFEAQIKACTTVEQLAALQFNWE
jgi:hypothetical protein